jgi:ATP-dependent helicase/nuclease subunit A
VRRFTSEQRAAIADRDGPALLAAGAGSGKTAVMVERFAEAVLTDGIAPASILTLTFTEKAAAELRERIRRRFTEAGEDEHARAVDAAWIGTIHASARGSCARSRWPRGWTRASPCSTRRPPAGSPRARSTR